MPAAALAAMNLAPYPATFFAQGGPPALRAQDYHKGRDPAAERQIFRRSRASNTISQKFLLVFSG